MVPERLRLLVGLGDEVQLDGDLELAPAGLGHLEGRRLDDAQAVRVRLVQLEGDLFDEVREVGGGVRGGGDGAHVEGPLMRVVGGGGGGARVGGEGFGGGAVD